MNPSSLKKAPNPLTLEDFDNSIVINHPSMPDNRQFVVADPQYGSGIWSATVKKPILPIDPANKDWVFKPITSSQTTPRIFWMGERDHYKNLFMAESKHECAMKVEIPKGHKIGSVLSGNILLLTWDQPTSPHKYRLYSIDTKGIIPLDADGRGWVDSIYIPKNGGQILLVFCVSDATKNSREASIFLIDSTKFTAERVTKGF